MTLKKCEITLYIKSRIKQIVVPPILLYGGEVK